MNRFDNYRTKIFLTGDSITEGDGNASAYRFQLFKRLYASGAAFEFLGPNTSGDLRLPKAYYHHGGYCGITIGTDPKTDPGLMAKLTNMPGYAEAVRDADIIVLWIGTNDYGRSIDLDHITDRLTDLIGKYYALNGDMSIYVGTLFDYSVKRPLNDFILDPSTKTSLEAKFPGIKYTGVDMNVGELRLRTVDNDFPEDDGHPAERGNSKIGESYFRAIIDEVMAISASKAPEGDAPIRVRAASGNLRDMTLRQGESTTFAVKVVPEDAEVTTILWESSNPTTATVDDYGRVRALIPGETIVTATTLDMGLKLSAKISVRGGIKLPYDGFTKIVFESDFKSEGKWSGPNDVFSPNFNKLALRWNKTKTGELVSTDALNVEGDFALSYNFLTANDRTHDFTRWIELDFAGYRMRTAADGGRIILYVGDDMVGEWSTMAPVATNDEYTMKREGSTVSLYRNGEFLFAAAACGEVGKTLTIRWNDMTKSDMRNIKISVR